MSSLLLVINNVSFGPKLTSLQNYAEGTTLLTLNLTNFFSVKMKHISVQNTGSYPQVKSHASSLMEENDNSFNVPMVIWQGEITHFLWEKAGFGVNLCFWVIINESLMWWSYLTVFGENDDASVLLMDFRSSHSWQPRTLGIVLHFFSPRSFPVSNYTLGEKYIKINQVSVGVHVCLYACMFKSKFGFKKANF